MGVQWKVQPGAATLKVEKRLLLLHLYVCAAHYERDGEGEGEEEGEGGREGGRERERASE